MSTRLADDAVAPRDGLSLSPAARAEAWLSHRFFPFWANCAAHPRGGFRERVALDGAPLNDPVSRVRVQARQTYVFARAALLGWEPDRARALVLHGVESLLGSCQRSDGLLGRLVRLGEGLEDDQPELYDNAFGVLALAWAARALEAPQLAAEAGAILERLDESHAHRAGGYHETLPPRTPRRQNPHMHLFEACTALAETTGSERDRRRAGVFGALFGERFFDATSGHVRERFDDNLAPLPGEAWGPIEPGHEFEWIALLDHHASLIGSAPPAEVAQLYDAAISALDANGFVPLALGVDGGAADASRRLWSQTEALRAHLTMAKLGDASAADRARALIDGVFAVHLDPAPDGAWIDHVDAAGAACVDSITAATGYHIVTAFAEVIESPAMALDRETAAAP